MFRGKWFRGLGQRFLRLSETKTRTRSIGTTFITQLTQGTKFVRFSDTANRGKSYTERNVDCISKLPNHTPPLGSSDSTSGSQAHLRHCTSVFAAGSFDGNHPDYAVLARVQ